MAAFEGPLKERLRPFLPATHADVRRESMFEKQKLASWSQDTANPSNGICHSGNRAQRKRADDSVYAGIGQRDLLSWQVEKFDI